MKRRSAYLRYSVSIGATLFALGAWAGPHVRVAQGELLGRQEGMIAAYLGIPFAEPPVGAKRWRPPQPPADWRGVRDATAFGASCMQAVLPDGHPPWTKEYVVQGKVNEDCLTLNVWTSSAAGAKQPVLVWIHGGGFTDGSGSVPIYNGRALANRGVMVVTINYRLGVFGFLAHPALTSEAKGTVPTNFGLQDQLAALRWVHDNIAVFGGDPDKVTIAGQSAGAVAVHSLMASPMAKGLFVRAIAQSGLPSVIPPQSLQEAERNGVAFARTMGCTSLAQLRHLGAEKLTGGATDSQGRLQFGPVVDGMLLPASPLQALTRAPLSDIPIIVGQTADEGAAPPGLGDGSGEAYQEFLGNSFGSMVDRFTPLYPHDTQAARSQARKDISRDRGLAMFWAWSHDRGPYVQAPIFVYYYTHVEPGQDASRFGAFHSSEIPYALATLDAAPERPFAAEDRRVSLTMSTYWINFIRTGDPNGSGLPHWPRFKLESPSILEIGNNTAVRPLLSAEKLQAYKTYLAAGGQLSMF